MPKPQYVRDAELKVSVLLRDLDREQRALVDQIHKLVIRMFQTSDSRLFAIYGYQPDTAARCALVTLFRQHPQLLIEARWVAQYLWCSEEDIGLYEQTTRQVVADDPNGAFKKTLASICREVGADMGLLLT